MKSMGLNERKPRIQNPFSEDMNLKTFIIKPILDRFCSRSP